MRRRPEYIAEQNRARWLFVGVLALVSLLCARADASPLTMYETHTWQEPLAVHDRPHLYWPTLPSVEHNPRGQLEKADEQLRYSLWSLSERMGSTLPYAGETSSTGTASRITVNWQDAIKMVESGRDLTTLGYTRLWFHLDTGIISSAEVYLNSTLLASSDKCRTQVIVHELLHALGATHTSSRQDVMHPHGASDCRYALSASDVAQLHYKGDTCYAELTMENDIYVLDSGGKTGLLTYLGDFTWALEHYGTSGQPANGCQSARVVEDRLRIRDLRGVDVRYSMVILRYAGTDVWRLEFAQ